MRVVEALWCFSFLIIVVCLRSPEAGGPERSLHKGTETQAEQGKERDAAALLHTLRQFVFSWTALCSKVISSWPKPDSPRLSRSLTTVGRRKRPGSTLLGGVELPRVNLLRRTFGQLLGQGYICEESFDYSGSPGSTAAGLLIRSRRSGNSTSSSANSTSSSANSTSSSANSTSSSANNGPSSARGVYLRGLASGKGFGAGVLPPAAGKTAVKGSVALPGVNLAGGEFGDLGQPMGQAYKYPPDESFTYFAKRGMRLVRVPFKLERVQPKAMGEFSSKDVAELDRCVRAARTAKLLIVLDAHNYGKRDGSPIQAADLADFWSRIAKRYQDQGHVALGLMNEPAAYQPDAWRKIVDQTLTTLRKAGSKHLVMVPGGGYTGAHDWVSGGNAKAFEGFSDKNSLLEVHQYLDPDSSGKSLYSYQSGGGATRLKAFTEWARAQGYGAFLGEYGFAMPSGETEARALLSYMQANSDVWLTDAYWAAGSLWKDYAYSIEPTPPDGDKPQMTLLKQFF